MTEDLERRAAWRLFDSMASGTIVGALFTGACVAGATLLGAEPSIGVGAAVLATVILSQLVKLARTDAERRAGE